MGGHLSRVEIVMTGESGLHITIKANKGEI